MMDIAQATHLDVEAGVRYWEDARTGNGGMTGFSLNLTLGESGGNQPLSAENSGKSPTQTLAKATDGKPDNAEIIRELTRAKVAFQLRAIKAVLGEVM